jgi:hypothetical protein
MVEQPVAEVEETIPEVVFTVEAASLDEDGYASIWNIASASMQGDSDKTRFLASKLLGFLCKQQCPYVVASSADVKYLDEFYERDNTLLTDWTAESDKVDVVSQAAYVPFDLFKNFLENNKFKISGKYNPRRSSREVWFNETWSVG